MRPIISSVYSSKNSFSNFKISYQTFCSRYFFNLINNPIDPIPTFVEELF
nr:MAG TPA: hypothetical protein [Caudoviricetes sp.]